MDNESQVMCQQMQDTRTSLQDKLETLEQQVKDSVQDTTDAVTGTAEAVRDTVESVKDTVQETIQAVKDTFNLSYMVNEHPWLMFATATGIGVVSARLLGSIAKPKVSSDEPAAPAVRPEATTQRNGYSARSTATQIPAPPRRSWLAFITDHYSEELKQVKGLAIATVGNVVREMLAEKAAPEIAARTRKIIDGIVTTLGAKPIEEPIFKAGDMHKDEMETKPRAF